MNSTVSSANIMLQTGLPLKRGTSWTIPPVYCPPINLHLFSRLFKVRSYGWGYTGSTSRSLNANGRRIFFFFAVGERVLKKPPFCQQSFHEGEIPMHPSACQLSSSVSFVYNTDRTHANGQTPPYKTSSRRGKIHWLI